MIDAQQKTTIEQLLSAQNYSGIVDIIVGNSDPQNDQNAITLSYLAKFAPGKALTIDNVTKLAEVFDTNKAAPSAALEAAYANFCEQAGIKLSTENKNITASEAEQERIDSALRSAEGKNHEEKAKNLANSMDLEGIKNIIDFLKKEIQPALQTHQIDQKLLEQLSIFRQAYSLKQGIKNEFTVWSQEGSLDEVETRKPVRMVEGLGLMKTLHEAYLETVHSPEDDNEVNQLLFLQENGRLSKIGIDTENSGNMPDNRANRLVKRIRAKITVEKPIKGDDMWWTDDKEYIFSNGSKIVVSKNDDHATYNLAFEGEKNGMTFVLSVHRVDSHGKLLPNAYDLVQYVDGDPVAVASSTEGQSAIKDYPLIVAQIELNKRPNFAALDAPAKKQAVQETVQPVEAVAVQPPAQETVQPVEVVVVQPPAQETVQPVETVVVQPPAQETVQPPAQETVQPPAQKTAQPPAQETVQPVEVAKQPKAKRATKTKPTSPTDETQVALDNIRKKLQNVPPPEEQTTKKQKRKEKGI